MIDGIFDLLFRLLYVYIGMIVCHEFGHFIAIVLMGVKFNDIRLRIIGFEYDSTGLTNDDKKMILFSGVLFGFFPLGLIWDLPLLIILFMAAAYSYGCVKDVKRIMRLNK